MEKGIRKTFDLLYIRPGRDEKKGIILPHISLPILLKPISHIQAVYRMRSTRTPRPRISLETLTIPIPPADTIFRSPLHFQFQIYIRIGS